MFDLTPSELPFGQVLLPPAFVAGVVGFLAAVIVAKILNRTRLSRFFWNPPLAFLAMWALLSSAAILCLEAL